MNFSALDSDRVPEKLLLFPHTLLQHYMTVVFLALKMQAEDHCRQLEKGCAVPDSRTACGIESAQNTAHLVRSLPPSHFSMGPSWLHGWPVACMGNQFGCYGPLAAQRADCIFQQPSLAFHIKTLFLFTKSDFKTVVFPQSIFAITAVLSAVKLTTTDKDHLSPADIVDLVYRVPYMLAWIWLNLLVEDIANQRLAGSIIEDAVNKPWRPLPSKRLTPVEARTWLLLSIVAAVGFSVVMGGFTPSICLMTLIWMYNDLDGSNSGIWIRNALNAGGLMCFSWGALEVLSQGELLPRAYIWILVTGGIVMTTVHAQDLPDMEGDIARGRTTIPLLHGEGVARGSLAVMVLFWSAICPAFWDVSPLGWVPPLSIGAVMASLSLWRRGQEWDEVVWKLWCLWMAATFVLPIFALTAC